MRIGPWEPVAPGLVQLSQSGGKPLDAQRRGGYPSPGSERFPRQSQWSQTWRRSRVVQLHDPAAARRGTGAVARRAI